MVRHDDLPSSPDGNTLKRARLTLPNDAETTLNQSSKSAALLHHPQSLEKQRETTNADTMAESCPTFEVRPLNGEPKTSQLPDGAASSTTQFNTGVPRVAGSGNAVATSSRSTANAGGAQWIDLTLDDDDDVVIVDERKVEDKKKNEVCFGAMRNATVNAHMAPFVSRHKHLPSRISMVRDTDPASPLKIHAYDNFGHRFGVVSDADAQIVVQLMDLNVLRLTFFLYPIEGNEVAGQPVSMPYKFFFHVFGSEVEVKKLAILLSRNNFYLDRPYESFDEGLPYWNVRNAVVQANAAVNHRAPDHRAPDAPPGNVAYVSRTTEEIKADVNKIFDGLGNIDNLPEMDPNPRITTPLLKHQKQGLHFLVSKEKKYPEENSDEDNGLSLWQRASTDGKQYYYHVITGQRLSERPAAVPGGLLADMMGLGKTLQILSLVVGSQEASKVFASSPTPRIPVATNLPIMNAKTTLLISPLSTIGNWEEQIQRHLKEEALDYHIYHGNRRKADADAVAGFDLVITTYQVVASEYSKHLKSEDTFSGPLQQLNFFRIVLDEAHMIRQQSTLQSKAVIALHAERRWAVTGTPVQNRLDDFASLVKFLRLKPFDDRAAFNQYICLPVKNCSANRDSLLPLRLLVNSITLRRQKDRIDLPPRQDEVVRLEFDPVDRELYDATQKQSFQRVSMVAKAGHIGGKNYVHILQMILRLRLICAHGRELLADNDTAELAGLTSADAINVDELDDSVPHSNSSARQAYQILGLMRETNEDICSLCTAKAVYGDPGLGDSTKAEEKTAPRSSTIGYLTSCAHMLCEDCVGIYKSNIPGSYEPGERATCPICGLINRIDFFELKNDELDRQHTGNHRKGPKERSTKYRGPSVKVRALLKDLHLNRAQSTAEDPIKSVVFSGWTTHLDLIGRAFRDNSIKFVRLDGSMSRADRNTAISEFRDNLELEVILVSLMAGGLGLNLTAASRVYIMEPQWNPAAEAQAIDRIHRLGQKKPVICVRYIVNNSFEDKILQVQKKKNDIANLTMAPDRSSKERLENIADLFN